eukprot:GHVS01107448.1.p1 GENE.GHVS01107448.1~~GHVS01107448.1.p1  ORF type:complete len:228 (+),score=53.03 GHVS01107448.1:70-684(+)
MAGIEHSFASGSGIYESAPRNFTEGRLIGRLSMGQSEVMLSELPSLLDTLRDKFRPDNYDLLANNCNHFCDSLCQRIIHRSLPAYINRAAWWGNMFRWFVPSPSSNGGANSSINLRSSQTSFVPFSGSGKQLTGGGRREGEERLLGDKTVQGMECDGNGNSAAKLSNANNNDGGQQQHAEEDRRTKMAKAALLRQQQQEQQQQQ